MDEQKIAELEASTAEAKKLAEEAGGADESLNKAAEEAAKILSDAKAALSQNPLDKELDKVNKDKDKKKRTEKEKAGFALHAIIAKFPDLKDQILGGLIDPSTLLDDDDSAPLTRGDLKKFEAEKAQKTAFEMANALPDAKERELVTHHLKETIKSSGNAEQDFRAALSIVAAAKNALIVEELDRYTKPKSGGSGSGAPPIHQARFELTEVEKQLMAMTPHLTIEKIKAAREATARLGSE